MLLDEAVLARMELHRLVPARPRRLLVLNWQDITHPRAGGAEKGRVYRRTPIMTVSQSTKGASLVTCHQSPPARQARAGGPLVR